MSDTDTIHDFLTYRISILAKKLDQRAARIIEERFNMRLVDWWVLGNLSATDYRAVRHLVLNIHIDKSQISRALARLIEYGLVDKIEDVQDKRSPLFFLTKKGDAVREEVLTLRVEENAALAAVLTPEEWKVLNSAMTRFNRFVEERETDAII